MKVVGALEFEALFTPPRLLLADLLKSQRLGKEYWLRETAGDFDPRIQDGLIMREDACSIDMFIFFQKIHELRYLKMTHRV